MRDLKSYDNNELTIDDAVSGGDIRVFYRTPTTQERVGYQSKSVQVKGRKLQLKGPEARVEFGAKIITGFREGDFGYDGKPISSDPKSPLYRENWKDLLRETAADILSALAVAVFDGTQAAEQAGDDVEEEGEPIVPLTKNSGD